MGTPLHVLIVEDSEDDTLLIARELRRSGYDLTFERVDTPKAFSAALVQQTWDVVISDYSMPRFDGLAALSLFKASGLDLPFVVVSGTIGEEVAVAAMKAGAHDYVMKDNLARLGPAVQRELHEARVRQARRQAEEQLRKLSHVVEQSPSSVIITDTAGNIEYVNPGFTRITGYSAEEAIGENLRILKSGQTPPEQYEQFWQAITAGDEWHGEFHNKKKSGEFYWELATVSAIRNSEGHITHFVQVAEDITARKRAEQLLQTLNVAALAMQRAMTHEEIFIAVAEELGKLGCNCMVLPIDEGKHRLFTRYLSHQPKAIEIAEKLVGLRRQDFSIAIEAVGTYQQVVWERKTVFIERGEDVLRQVLPGPARRLAGQLIKLLRMSKAIAAPLIVGDEVIGVLSVQSDDLTKDDVPAITAFAHQMAAVWRKAQLMQNLAQSLEELKLTQAQLVQAQKMEALGRLASGVAHDFNNLLTAITGYTDLLLDDFADNDLVRADLKEIKKAADRAASLTDQLLAFSRKKVLQPKVLNLNAVVADIEKMLQRLIGEDVALITILRPAIGQVKADPGQIQQVIMNLAINARDAMPQGGKLTIETANVELDEIYTCQRMDIQPGPYVMLAVSDNGIGMDKEIQQHLFEPFFTTKQDSKGTGLGLATVHGIVKQSGGGIYVNSNPGQGTTFKIYLPRFQEASELSGPDVLHTGMAQGSETILLVEDDDMVRDLTRRILLQCGYVVLEAYHARDALQICKQHEAPIHLMITDVVMPGGMSGRDLAKRLAGSRPEMRVLYMSGYTDDAIVHHGVLDPGLAFLQKPFTPDTLTRKAREVLDAPLVP